MAIDLVVAIENAICSYFHICSIDMTNDLFVVFVVDSNLPPLPRHLPGAHNHHDKKSCNVNLSNTTYVGCGICQQLEFAVFCRAFVVNEAGSILSSPQLQRPRSMCAS